jgi:alpha-1,2-mannosyltransferase
MEPAASVWRESADGEGMATQERARPHAWLHRAVLPLAVVILAAQVAVVAVWPAAHLLMIDLQVYRAGGAAVLHGAPLYGGGVLLDLPFVYPPFAAIVFVPLSLLPLGTLKTLWTAATVALVAFVVRRSSALVGWAPTPAATVLLVVVLLALDPIHTTINLGQINVVLLALVLADMTARPGRFRGIGVGLAAALKLTPLVFVAYLLLIGRRRAAATALATFAGSVGIGFLLDPADSAAYWLDGTFAAADRISPVAGASNHSLAGLLARTGAPGWVGLAAAAALGVAGLAVAVRAHRRGAELLGLTICGLLAAAVAPFAWSHHYVWFGPLVVLLARHLAAGERPAAAALAGLLAITFAWITQLPGPGVGPLPSTGLISLQPDIYVAAVIVIVGVAARWPASPLIPLTRAAGKPRSCNETA